MTTAAVELWGSRIGAVSWDAERSVGRFEYDPDFARSGIEVAPLTMPLGRDLFSFPGLGRECFHGLPGLLADSLPDRFGNALIDAWLAAKGRDQASFDPVQRLCYVGARGMGALEFAPAILEPRRRTTALDVAALVDLASAVVSDRARFAASFADAERTDAVHDLLRVGTSAGGARAKAVIAWNPDTNEVRSGQLDAPEGFSHWLLKLDGVVGDTDREIDVPLGYGRIEYAYHRMAVAAGVPMSECRLLIEGGRAHFATRRFDRTERGAKLHMQSLCALAHLDFNLPGAHAWEQAFDVARRIGLGAAEVEQLLRRAVFNVVARNQDDHTKNVAFLMDRRGRWSLAPAFDVTYAYNPNGTWTGRHQMSLAGKRDDFTLADLTAAERSAGLVRGRARRILDATIEAVRAWPEHAATAGVPEDRVAAIGATHRLRWAEG
ncbi:type II toxin-antitoxin system HipA family toxin [Engelhardtia mirabilis]|uniref:Putative DNA-binding transcriptional regulator n=1 Tax=Engelhardtia mirabilis TaxID=2528011 RepID=A0A518BEG3_9BACT|nr:putative DNA-binding transcriptional regulator [Planctomycetes bacterium Pla133]QDU99599.1 putative DNA-binding transcriptional regulator [Planctomycetes bacterium Pla86]